MVNEDNPAVSGYGIRFFGIVEGNASMHVWDFGDGAWVTNMLSAEHDWKNPGSYEVVLTAYNADWTDGVSATQVVEIVDADGCTIHVSPAGDDANDGLGWETAKATIQAGVDAQHFAGGLIWVDGGTYALTNEIIVNKSIRIVGVDGPGSTIVDGQGTVRGFNLGNSACVLEGLTITNGYTTGEGGGVSCSGMIPVITNCTISGNSAYRGGGMVYGTVNNCTLSGNSGERGGGGMYYGTANNCIISGNSSPDSGGGMYWGTANNCIITRNSGYNGGGLCLSTANNCTISGNSATTCGGGMLSGTANYCTISGNTASQYGGGMFGSTANNCTISGNSSQDDGGGMYEGTAISCTITGNSSQDHGGGMCSGTANNCTITGNSTDISGGGLCDSTANNCTISGNSAAAYGGGMLQGAANNCIIYYNSAVDMNDLLYTTASYSCSPDVTHGVNGNITTAPVFVDAANGDYRLAAGSPCIDAGSNTYVVGSFDLAGLPRIVGGVVDMGAYEYQGAGLVDEDGDSLPDDWEIEHFGGTSSQRAEDDFDNDGIDNGSEWIAGTNPSDPNSVFTASVSTNQVSADGFVVEWTSVEDRVYSVLWGRTLTNAYDVLQDGIEYPQNSYTDTVHAAESAGFYQIEVQLK